MKYLLTFCFFFAFTCTTFAQQKQTAISLDYQNPIRSLDEVVLHLADPASVQMAIVDITTDRIIKLIINQDLIPGDHNIPLVVSDIPAGEYILKLETPEHSSTQPITVVHTPKHIEGDEPIAVTTEETVVVKRELIHSVPIRARFANPIRSGNDLTLILGGQTDVKITLNTTEGRFMKLIANQILVEGEHAIPLIVSDLPAGDYQLQIETPDLSETHELTIVHE